MFLGKKFDVEHALHIIADGFITLPAREIYNEHAIEPNAELASRCHIYFVGLVPMIQVASARQEAEKLIIPFEYYILLYDFSIALKFSIIGK